jgi:hypothetical protein
VVVHELLHDEIHRERVLRGPRLSASGLASR